MEEGFKDFLVKVKRAKGKKVFKIKDSFKFRDFYSRFNKAKKRDGRKIIIPIEKYRDIISECNFLLGEELLRTGNIMFPCKMGRLTINKYRVYPELDENDNLIYKAPIDWNKTLKYWYECPEAEKKKILIRVEPGDVFKLCYHRGYYVNKTVFTFSPMRTLKERLKVLIKEDKIDGLN